MVMPALPTVDALLPRLQRAGIVLPPGRVRVDGYGDSPELSRQLLALIRGGKKRAGTSLFWQHEAESAALPEVGDIEIVVDHRGEPALVTRITAVAVLAYGEVGEAYAAIEGEGDGSLRHWREAHWAFFSRACAQLGRVPHEDMPVVCSVFELLHDLPEG